MSQNKESSMFEVEQHVICVDDEHHVNPDWSRLSRGQVYTVSGFGNWYGEDGLFLAEIVSPSGKHMLFHPERFRPLPSSQISIINSMLVRAKDKVKA